MDTLTAKPTLLKQANLSLIRRSIRSRRTATRAEIAQDTEISFTTIRSLLSEMLENEEIEVLGYDESSGGRKAARYRLRPDRYHGAAFCITSQHVYCLTVNACGEIQKTERFAITGGNISIEPLIISYLDRLTSQKEIKSIGIGVSGVVDGISYWKKLTQDDTLYQINIGETLAKRYGIPIILENDINATAIGFSKCYESEFPAEDPADNHMAYLHFEEGCLSAGFISRGSIVRGHHNFAGELGLVPVGDNKTLDECFSHTLSDSEYNRSVIQTVCWVCAILNPQYVVLGGPALRKDCIGPVSDGLLALLPEHMSAEILYSADSLHDYLNGMAYLTAGNMFDEVQFIKE